MAWLVAGLGNPGDRYERTRHNIGKLVVEELARSGDARLKKVGSSQPSSPRCGREMNACSSSPRRDS
jgi:peptidyl-tRNA hydrolase